jgi:hypothetical protein
MPLKSWFQPKNTWKTAIFQPVFSSRTVVYTLPMNSTSTDLEIPLGSEEQNLKLASKIASVTLLYAQQELCKRAIDPTVTTRGLLDISEHSYKVSGMAKKQEPAEKQGKVIFNINLGDGQVISLQQEKDVTPAPDTYDDPMAAARDAITLTQPADTLAPTDIFAEAPEFR